MLEFKNISYTIGQKQILRDISFKLETGKITTVLGSNGSGKSTLIKLLLKKASEYEGIIEYELQPFIKTSEVSILMQSTTIPDHFTVYDFMKYSLVGSRSLLSKVTNKDQKQIDNCLAKCDSLQFKSKLVSELSGGERQRVIISAALVTNPKVLILDEPTTFLDIKYQTVVLSLIKALNKQLGMTILVVIHEINQGLRIADNVVILKDGMVVTNKRSNDITELDLKRGFDIPFTRHGHNTFVTKINEY